MIFSISHDFFGEVGSVGNPECLEMQRFPNIFHDLFHGQSRSGAEQRRSRAEQRRSGAAKAAAEAQKAPMVVSKVEGLRGLRPPETLSCESTQSVVEVPVRLWK